MIAEDLGKILILSRKVLKWQSLCQIVPVETLGQSIASIAIVWRVNTDKE